MRPHRPARTAFTAWLGGAAILAVAAASVPAAAGTEAARAPAAAAPAGAASSLAAARAAGAGQAPAGATRPVLLINGDRLRVTPTRGGGRVISLLPAATGDSVTGLRLGRLRAEIPADALPYLGRSLDLSLFELGPLQRAEAGGKLRVALTFVGRRPVLPGVTVTRSRPGHADGYLTAASARVFGAALARQFRADHGRASYGSEGMFRGGLHIALAAAAAPAAKARPQFPMHTLTVTGSDLSGKADTGDLVWLFNADNVATFGDGNENLNFFDHGVAKFSVPAGHYWAVGDFFNFNNTSASEHLAFLPQFTAGRHTTVHVAAKAASSEITMVTPRPAVTQAVNFEVVRGDRDGSTNAFTWSDSGVSLWVSPTTRKPAVGSLSSFASAQLTSPPGPGIPYAYNLDYAGPAGIIPPQHYVATHANLATVNERYYQDVRTTGAWSAFGGFPVQLDGFIISQLLPVTLPGLQTQYLSAAPTLAWSSSYAEFTPADAFPWGGQFEGTFRALQAGRAQRVEWNRFPLHPQPDVSPGGIGGRLFPLMPSAVRSANALTLFTTPFSDNQRGHLGAGFSAGPGVRLTGSYQIDQNGVQIAHGNPVNGIPVVQLSPKSSVISFALNAGRWGRVYPLSPSSRTVWTWRSARQAGVKLPPAWFCGITSSGQLLTRCVVQPMMTLGYQVHGLALTGSVPPGPQAIALSVGHLQLAKAAAVTGATAQVSYNDGQSWRAASVAASGGGKFLIGFTAPGGVDVTLRVSATDAAGGSVRETILRAYSVTF